MFDKPLFDGDENLRFFRDATRDLNGVVAARASRLRSVMGRHERPQS